LFLKKEFIKRRLKEYIKKETKGKRGRNEE
jgi:hypothetical protein